MVPLELALSVIPLVKINIVVCCTRITINSLNDEGDRTTGPGL
jgi:hypothetical protein